MPVVKKNETYFISAGEFSGELLGADLALALKEVLPRLQAFGITGTAMENAGVQSIASIDEMSVMGIVEVAKKLPDLRMLESRILHRVEQLDPKFAILIDNPGFHIRLAEQLRMRGIKVFQYVAPKVWAWGKGRLPQLRQNFDMILGILPFEEEFFHKNHVNYKYVGSPHKDRTDKVMVSRESLGVPSGQTMVACLPGSRMTEVARILPIISRVRELVLRDIPDATFVVPVPRNMDCEEMASFLWQGSERAPVEKVEGVSGVTTYECAGLKFVQGMSLEIMAASDVAIVASGTATLECALLGTPMSVVYSMNEFTYAIAKNAVKIPYVSLVNLMSGRRLVNEYIQDFSLHEVAEDVVSLIRDDDRRKRMKETFEDLRDHLKGTAAATAAQIIAEESSKPSTSWI